MRSSLVLGSIGAVCCVTTMIFSAACTMFSRTTVPSTGEVGYDMVTYTNSTIDLCLVDFADSQMDDLVIMAVKDIQLVAGFSLSPTGLCVFSSSGVSEALAQFAGSNPICGRLYHRLQTASWSAVQPPIHRIDSHSTFGDKCRLGNVIEIQFVSARAGVLSIAVSELSESPRMVFGASGDQRSRAFNSYCILCDETTPFHGTILRKLEDGTWRRTDGASANGALVLWSPPD